MNQVQGSEVRSVMIACEAGMGSSVLLTTQMSQRLKPYGVSVTHGPVNRLSDGTADVVLCHSGLSGRARQAAPNTVILPFTMFMGDPAFDKLEGAIRDDEVLEG